MNPMRDEWHQWRERARSRAEGLSDHRPYVRRGRRRQPAAQTPGRASAALRLAFASPAFRKCSRPARTRSQRRGHFGLALGNMGPDDWRWHMADTVKGAPTLARRPGRDRAYLCRQAPAAVYELDHWGVPFSRTEEGKIYQRPFGGMTTDYGKGIAQRAPARRPTAPATPSCTLYGQALKAKTEFFIEYFAIDLIRDSRGPRARPRLPQNGRRHDPSFSCADDDPCDRRLWPRLFFRHLRPYLHRRRQCDGAARRPARCRTWNSCNSTTTGIYGAAGC